MNLIIVLRMCVCVCVCIRSFLVGLCMSTISRDLTSHDSYGYVHIHCPSNTDVITIQMISFPYHSIHSRVNSVK